VFLHIDIDSFFASAESSQDASLKDKPICVGSRSNLEIFERNRLNIKLMNDNNGAFVAPVFHSDRHKSFENYFVDEIEGRKKIRGIVTTASYEARKYGVKTAMPIAQALQLCPHMIVVPPNYPLYHRISHRLHRFLMRYIPQVEQFSIDEFFGDLNGWIEDENVYSFARDLQSDIKKLFDIPVSIGISGSKWIAKLATESAKPFGIYEVKDIESYIEKIPIKQFPGIGRGYQRRLEDHYIYTLGDVRRNKVLLYSWKKPGIQLYHRVTGTDHEGISIKGERKSIGISRTFDPIYQSEEVRRRVMIMARHIVYMVMEKEVNPTIYSLKINYEYGVKVKQTMRLDRVFSEMLFKKTLLKIYEEIALPQMGAIKLSLNVSDFSSYTNRTLSMLELDEDINSHKLSQKLCKLRERFGLDIIKTADEL
jgi:DNA polymerase-4